MANGFFALLTVKKLIQLPARLALGLNSFPIQASFASLWAEVFFVRRSHLSLNLIYRDLTHLPLSWRAASNTQITRAKSFLRRKAKKIF